MLFRELSSIGLDVTERENSTRILINDYGMDAPNPVIEQLYVDHGDKGEFIALYGNLNLDKIKWSLTTRKTKVLTDFEGAATHPDFVNEVSVCGKYFDDIGDRAIDGREDVALHWRKTGTWMTPPIFIDGRILENNTAKLHLVEGHSRLGTLIGMHNHSCIRLAKQHEIYYGNY